MTDTDVITERILTRYDTITVVGASRSSYKTAHSVPAHMQQHGWRIIPVNPHADQILGEWLQLGIASAEARAIAEDAGLLYVEDRCLIIEQRRLHLDAPVPG